MSKFTTASVCVSHDSLIQGVAKKLRAALAISFAPLFIGVAAAEQSVLENYPEDCQRRPGQTLSCTPVLACLADGGVFLGTATGWYNGTLEVDNFNATSCTGSWIIHDTVGNYGQAGFECTDGRSGTAQFSYLDIDSESIWGDGTLTDGTSFRVWTGPRLRAFLKENSKDIQDFCPTIGALS